ncbi:EXS family protein/ERD1/XPR1/SYG1 family protein [Suillus subalutaceus]|uniref:EXS family protein/ERD1/XPR1/SYG1 family protein n=1 Tax=Suillus subalutaceus TaxID=48586 RepID=UPI001B85EE61|nr:EXS family protein/ERD1/XPR1/SYG1 family protein [Suillus subalutaceus]KAG1862041.1 EXS family protein/ERD1/XPR1/SYG1 family protein [Suillus subalutaceus]
MKFARYLNDTQTPEWKRAYIDYRCLKKCIGAIRAEHIARQNSTGTTDIDHVHKQARDYEGHNELSLLPQPDAPVEENSTLSATQIQRRNNQMRPSLRISMHSFPPPPHLTGSSSQAPSQETPLPPKTAHLPPIFPFFRDAGSPAPAALHTILPLLPPLHANFFELLDSELEKVDSFYAEREKEMRDRGKLLKEQLNELGLHRKKYYESNPDTTTPSWAARARLYLAAALLALTQCHTDKSDDPPELVASESYRGGHSTTTGDGGTSERKIMSPLPASTAGDSTQVASLKSNRPAPPTKANGNIPLRNNIMHFTSPQEYQNAKKRLKKAVVEYYRGLEALNNYRILNLTGFRKAVKKYEKITQVPAQAAYMKERVEPSAFASGAMVSSMLKEMEELFAARFERGDKKKAITRLRVGTIQKSHHFSTFRTGMWLGLSIPATIIGFITCLRHSTATSLPSWNIILFIYSILLIPALLALLVGLNLVVWARERINYVFIFEFNLPAFLLCALAYCFMLSFIQVGPPLIWPLVWLALVVIVVFNPIPIIFRGHSRWWLIKSVARLGVSGLWTVEFTDFWLGDQFCSLVYSLSNFYFVGCFYSQYFPYVPSYVNASSSQQNTSMAIVPRFFSSSQMSSLVPRDNVLSSAYDSAVQEAWSTCGAESHWGPYFVLAMLPFLVRFVQSVRRYRDSKLPSHLINAGKYGMGMVYYFCYYLWKRDGETDNGASFILWCLSAVIYSLYGCAWDFAMDWSICRPHAKYPLLRRELVYTSQIPLYYVAMVTNFFIRFLWVFYIPNWPYFNTRSFISALMEMVRRVVWNFYRLENEHLGNMDQYRITREVPLPYPFDNPQLEDDDDEEDKA